jgi:hypothetical protein
MHKIEINLFVRPISDSLACWGATLTYKYISLLSFSKNKEPNFDYKKKDWNRKNNGDILIISGLFSLELSAKPHDQLAISPFKYRGTDRHLIVIPIMHV